MKPSTESGRAAEARARSYPKAPTVPRDRGLRSALASRTCAVGLVLACGSSACVSTPVTGKKAFLPFSTSEDMALGAQAYGQVLAQEKVVASGPEKETVERVMQRLVAVADDPGFSWEVKLLDSPETVNAFCLPGGKMAVYTGILPVCKDERGDYETGLAVVMGHEIAHAVARHGMQRMTEQMGLQLVTSLFDAGAYQELVGPLISVAIELPFGRADESEADHIGLVYMARAGYDPRQSVAFWERMGQLSGDGPPEFLSTHPSHETRVQQLQKLMPAALKEYEQATAARP